MSFEGFVCWNPDLIQRVMNTEALQTENAVFLATHHPVRMYRQSLKQVDAREEYDQSRFLKDFLGPRFFAFVPVLGNAGTGKSHLIRWLALNIPEATNRKVVLIPKGGTNLRDVIHRILEGMEGHKFDEYRERLTRATTGMTDAGARQTLLGNLAVAIGAHGGGVRAREMQNVDRVRREAYEFFEDALQPLLLDALFRQHLLRDGGIIADLVRHTMGTSEVRERREARRQFSVEDLPLNVLDLQKAGAAAREIYGALISDPELQALAVEWLNLHLDEAMGQLLQMGGDDLTRLMREVRADLAEQKMELVLLIEDFAKLQGIERPLLEAILEQPNQVDGALCVLRTALACTTDYFRGVADTVRQRTTFVVSLDREALGSGGMVTEEDFKEFAARYLNAIRLNEHELDQWYGRRRGSGEEIPVPNACESCAYQGTCHPAFGSAQNRGLYPFNRTALIEMYGRAQDGDFSPRLLIADVLKRTLESYGGDLAKGAFPSPALLASFGGSRLGAATKREIATRDPAHADRREAFVEFWTGGQVVDLDEGVHDAFRLPRIGVASPNVRSPGPDGPKVTPPPQPAQVLPSALEEKLEKLDAWQNGAELAQGLTNELRSLVHAAVTGRIDWDAERLVRGAFAATSGKPFRNTSINFQNQAAQTGAALVRLTIPGKDSSLPDASLVLQGLLLHEHYGHWNFAWGLGGARYFRIYARLLDGWSREVLEQIRRGFLEDGSWDPLPAAVEVLAIGARLLGEPASGASLLENQMAALFVPASEAETVERGPLWNSVLKTFLTKRQLLIDLVTCRAAATKGGSMRVQVLDAAQLVGPLKAAQVDLVPKETLPASLPNIPEYAALRQVQEKFREGLDAAIDEERSRALQRYARVARALEWEDGIKEVGPILKEAVRRAHEAGVFSGAQPEELDRAVAVLNKAPLVRWQDSIKAIASAESDRKVLLAELGQNHEAAVRAAERFVDLAERFLNASTGRVRSQVEKLEEAGGRDLEACYVQIEGRFEQLDTLIGQLMSEAEVSAGAAAAEAVIRVHPGGVA